VRFRSWSAFVGLQIEYSLLERTVEQEPRGTTEMNCARLSHRRSDLYNSLSRITNAAARL
jgi:hypothetical protein